MSDTSNSNKSTNLSSWVCKGTFAKKHEKLENWGDNCMHPDCSNTRKSSASVSRKPREIKKSLLPLLALAIACFGFGGYKLWKRNQPNSPDILESELDGTSQTQSSSENSTPSETSQPGRSIPAFKPEWVSEGDRVLFGGTGNKSRDDGIEAFRNGNYTDAIEYFERAVFSSKNDPEVQIYLNNAKAAKQGSPLKIAAVVPINEREASAKEMLRGIADAQTEFNDAEGVRGRLVQIIIANDYNNPNIARGIAKELASNSEVLGVIGHNSSDVSKAALAEYEKANLVMISPTSTATHLKSDYFFRTVPSDTASGQKLAGYARKTGVEKVAIFYDSNSDYSKSLREAFESSFKQLGGSVLRAIDLSSQSFDPQQEIKKFENQQVEAIALFPSTKTTSTAIGIARANTELLGQKLTMLGGDALYSSDTLNNGGTAVNGLIIAIPWFAQSQPYAKKAYQRWVGTVNWRTAASFDATKALLKTLSIDTDRVSVAQNLQSINLRANETSGEPLSFANGESKVDPVLVQIDSGAFGQSGKFENGFKLIQP